MGSKRAIAAQSESALREAYIQDCIRTAFRRTEGFRSIYPLDDPEATLAKLRVMDRLPLSLYGEAVESDIRELLRVEPVFVGDRRLSAAELLDLLDRGAEELTLEDVPARRREDLGSSQEINAELLELLSSEGRRRYLDTWGDPVFVYARPGKPVIAFAREDKRWGCNELSFALTMSILYGTWRFGHVRHPARNIICERYAEMLNEIRAQAQRNLDQAVAISGDASLLYTAEHVIIFGGTVMSPEATLYAPDAFRIAKLVIPAGKGFRRRKVKSILEHVLTLEGILPVVVSLLSSETLRQLLTVGDETILCSHKSVSGDVTQFEGRILL